MIKKIEMPNVRGIVIREPINIDEPTFLDDHTQEREDRWKKASAT